ncbi:hypothetical protein MTX25_34390 [Bradyrhizobium sp. ISRA432]|uniref:hypothetical protein n=1 Tax=Bradyrhizobium sp. ISRA442 TaxID=2866197 RepID=UPI0027A032B2|nr:hypothetical protein MTX25_34390 [Bradyrhizobium sp. ISRA432]
MPPFRFPPSPTFGDSSARHPFNLYAASLPAEDTRHRALVAALVDDFARLAAEG